jgi:hypothetical protein
MRSARNYSEMKLNDPRRILVDLEAEIEREREEWRRDPEEQPNESRWRKSWRRMRRYASAHSHQVTHLLLALVILGLALRLSTLETRHEDELEALVALLMQLLTLLDEPQLALTAAQLDDLTRQLTAVTQRVTELPALSKPQLTQLSRELTLVIARAQTQLDSTRQQNRAALLATRHVLAQLDHVLSNRRRRRNNKDSTPTEPSAPINSTEPAPVNNTESSAPINSPPSTQRDEGRVF